MPLITISMYPGRSDSQKQELAEVITEKAVEILKTKPEHVIIIYDEKPREDWFLAGNIL